jgi:hypothetical protein
MSLNIASLAASNERESTQATPQMVAFTVSSHCGEQPAGKKDQVSRKVNLTTKLKVVCPIEE